MALTERQCWKVVRDLVVEKNKEYQAFLVELFGVDGYKELQGHTRGVFLAKFGFRTWEKFNAHAAKKSGGKEPNARWLENLSTNDLLLFLDFRCRALQDMYDLYKVKNNLSLSDVKEIVSATKLSVLASYNKVELQCGSKPTRVENEKKNAELGYTKPELNEIALQQVLSRMAGEYAKNLKTTDEYGIKVAEAIQTSNVTPKGEQTGYKLKAGVLVDTSTQSSLGKKTVESGSKTERAQTSIHAIGFSEKDIVFVKDNKFVNLLGTPIPNAVVIKTMDQIPVPPFTEREYFADTTIKKMLEQCAIEHEFTKESHTHKVKHVGLNIQATPIHEDENGNRYTSTGELVAEDEFIDISEDGWGL